MLGEQDKVPFSLHRRRVFLGLDHMRFLLQDRDPGFPLQLGEEELQSFPDFQVPHIREFPSNWQKVYHFPQIFANFFYYYIFLAAMSVLVTSLLMLPILYFREMSGFELRELL